VRADDDRYAGLELNLDRVDERLEAAELDRLQVHEGASLPSGADAPPGHDGQRVPAPTRSSHGPTKPFGPSNSRSARSISLHASSRSASGSPASIWCRAPNESRSSRVHSAALAMRRGASTRRTSTSAKPA